MRLARAPDDHLIGRPTAEELGQSRRGEDRLRGDGQTPGAGSLNRPVSATSSAQACTTSPPSLVGIRKLWASRGREAAREISLLTAPLASGSRKLGRRLHASPICVRVWSTTLRYIEDCPRAQNFHRVEDDLHPSRDGQVGPDLVGVAARARPLPTAR